MILGDVLVEKYWSNNCDLCSGDIVICLKSLIIYRLYCE